MVPGPGDDLADDIQAVRAAVERQAGFVLHLGRERPYFGSRDVGGIGYDEVKLALYEAVGLHKGDTVGNSVSLRVSTGHRERVVGNVGGHAAPGAGETYVFSGKDGRLLLTLRAEAKGDAFGRKVSGLGDVNGDGDNDVIVGAPASDVGGEDAGRAYVFSGKDGALLLTLTGEEAGDGFGSSAAGLFDGDDEFIVVGAPNAGPQNKGRAYVYSGSSGEIDFIIDAEETGSQLGGMFVSVVGDVNADGVADIYASDWSDNALGAQTGRIYVHSGANGERLLTLTGEQAGDGFGIGRADAGDVDKDGHDDLIVGAWQHSGAAPAGGKVYLYSGKDGSLMRAYTSKVQGDTLGFDATGMDDVDGDGTIDFLVTSAWSAIGGARTGRMFILSGETP